MKEISDNKPVNQSPKVLEEIEVVDARTESTSPVKKDSAPAAEPVKDYYEGSFWKKVLDFCIGFFWPYAIVWGIPVIFGFIGAILDNITLITISIFLMIICMIAMGVVYIIFLVKNVSKRRYILIGFISALVFPLLFFIGCLAVFSSMGMFG